jgi:hypothetical protein
MTPEGKVKKKIRKVLDKYEGSIYIFMSVPSGFGKQTLDYLCIFRGRGFAIEAKVYGEHPTTRQEGHIDDITDAGGPVFVIDGDDSLAVFEEWLDAVAEQPALTGAIYRPVGREGRAAPSVRSPRGGDSGRQGNRPRRQRQAVAQD